MTLRFLLAWTTACALAAPSVAAPLAMQQVAPGVFVHQGQQQAWMEAQADDVANLAFIVGDRCVAVVDTGGSPAIGQRLLAAVAQATPLPPAGAGRWPASRRCRRPQRNVRRR